MLNRLNQFTQSIGPEGSNLILTVIIAFLRGLLNHDNLCTVVVDSALCGVFSLALLHTEYFSHIYASSHDSAILVCMLIGGVGSKYLLKVVKNIFDSILNTLSNSK